MDAHACNSKAVACCLSRSVMPSAGATSSAEPPPDSRQTTSVRASAACTIARMRFVPASPASFGTGWAASTCSMMVSGNLCPYFTTISPAEMRSPSNASAACAMRAVALPAPTTMMRSNAARSKPASPTCRQPFPLSANLSTGRYGSTGLQQIGNGNARVMAAICVPHQHRVIHRLQHLQVVQAVAQADARDCAIFMLVERFEQVHGAPLVVVAHDVKELPLGPAQA